MQWLQEGKKKIILTGNASFEEERGRVKLKEKQTSRLIRGPDWSRAVALAPTTCVYVCEKQEFLSKESRAMTHRIDIYPTGYFAALEPLNPWIEVAELDTICRSSLKL